MGKGERGRARAYGAEGRPSMAGSPVGPQGEEAQDEPEGPMDPGDREDLKGRAAGRVTLGSAGMVLPEGSEYGTCGFCGASPFYGATAKIEHLRDAHGMTPNTPGCEAHGRVFPSWDDYEAHRAAEHAD